MIISGLPDSRLLSNYHVTVTPNGVFTTPDGHSLVVPASKFEVLQREGLVGTDVIFGIRPEDIYDDEDHINAGKDVITINVDVAELLGATTNIHFDMNGSHVCAAVAARADIHIGDELKLAIDMEKCHFFDPETQLCVTVPFYVRPTKAE